MKRAFTTGLPVVAAAAVALVDPNLIAKEGDNHHPVP